MEKPSIKKNYIYNIVYQVLTLITPLITTPYISRVLGAEAIGIYSYTNSVVSYFILFATLGTATYGQRIISYNQDNRRLRSIHFWKIKVLNLISAGVCFIIYIVFAFFQQYTIIYLVHILSFFSVVVDITWLYQGMERFGIIVIRNIIFKIINIIFIFIFVKSSNDLIIYILSFVLLNFLSNLSLWINILGLVEKVKLCELFPFKNIKEIFSLFIPTIAIQIYTVFDKTMIGIFTGDSFQNGYYEQAMKIISISLMAVTAFGTVINPRICFYYEKKDFRHVQKLTYTAYRIVCLLAIPICLGIVGIADKFVPWFYGVGYGGVIPILKILSFLIVIIGFSNVTGTVYLVSTKQQNIFTKTVVIGAVINFCMNIFFIPKYQAVGAAVASLIAECVITILQLYFIRNELSVKYIIMLVKNYLIAALVMLIIIWVEAQYLSNYFYDILLIVATGFFVYFFVLLLLRDEFIYKIVKIIMH